VTAAPLAIKPMATTGQANLAKLNKIFFLNSSFLSSRLKTVH